MPHSPGPWSVASEEWPGSLRVVGADGKPVWFFDHAEQDGYNDNVRLMIAAPELLAALRKVTANLRAAIESEGLPAWLERDGVLAAEALLRRIDEGGDRG